MRVLLLPLLLLGGDEPSYPLGPLSPRSLTEPGRPLVLTDLRYRLAHEAENVQAFSVRARVASWGFLGALVDDQRRGLSLQTQRLALGYFADPSFTNLQAGWRGSRLLLEVEAERRPPQDGHGWTIDGALGLRLAPDLEAFASLLADTDRRATLPRTVASQALGVLWQRGTRLDLTANLGRSEVRTQAGFDLETLRASAGAAGYAWASEAAAEVGFERTRGRTPRDEIFASASLRSVVGGRWLAEARSQNRWEPGVRWFDHEIGAGLSLHARRVRLPRAGEAATRTLGLARRAVALGYNERRVYDTDGRRALRERLALSPRRAELAAELLALHRAQVDEREVPLVGVAGSERYEAVSGVRRRSLEAFLGVAWPPRWPWRHDEASVPFLVARYTRVAARFGNGFTSLTHSAALEAELNREMSLVLRWRRPGLTPLDVTLRTGGARSWEVEYVYALGR